MNIYGLSRITMALKSEILSKNGNKDGGIFRLVSNISDLKKCCFQEK